MRILVTICARGGSKGVKNKNIRPMLGKPLIAYTIETAKKWKRANRIIVSTDSDEIANISREYGADVPFKRPAELATGAAPKIPVIQHAVRYLKEIENDEYDVIVDLDPTSPLRDVEDLENAYELMVTKKPKTLVSVCPSRRNPYYNMIEVDSNGYAHVSKKSDIVFVRRQDAPVVYEQNASIYIYWAESIFKLDSDITDKTIVYVMPRERSIDIDSETDFKLVTLLMQEKLEKKKIR